MENLYKQTKSLFDVYLGSVSEIAVVEAVSIYGIEYHLMTTDLFGLELNNFI